MEIGCQGALKVRSIFRGIPALLAVFGIAWNGGSRISKPPQKFVLSWTQVWTQMRLNGSEAFGIGRKPKLAKVRDFLTLWYRTLLPKTGQCGF